MSNNSKHTVAVLSLHWGYSLGGIGKYATLIEALGNFAPIKLKSVCIIGKTWQLDKSNIDKISVEKIIINSRFDPSWVAKIVSIVNDCSPDMIMTHGFNGHFVAFLVHLLFRKRIPIVSSYHGLYHPATSTMRFFERPFNFMTEFFLRHIAVGVVCVAEHSKSYLCSKKIDPLKISAIHNGIENWEPDHSKRHELRRQWGVEAGELLFGAASRLDPVKGIDYLIEAMHSLKTSSLSIKLVIIGTGTVEKQLKDKVNEIGLSSRVIFPGFRNDIDQCLGAIDVFVLPSLAEYHSIAILEAMRAAKPIIATDVGGNTESLRHLHEGFIVPAKDPAMIAAAMKTLAENEGLRQKLGQNARERFLEEFTVDVMIKKTAEWLMDCADKAKISSKAMQ